MLTACNAARPTRSGKVFTHRFLGASVHFFDPSNPFSMTKVDDMQKQYTVQGALYAVQEGYMDAQEGCILYMRIICCLWGFYAVQVGYMDVQEDCILFRGVLCCSGGLYVSNDDFCGH